MDTKSEIKNNITTDTSKSPTDIIKQYKLYAIIILITVVAGIIYVNSPHYLVNKTLKKLKVIEDFQIIKSYNGNEELPLKKMSFISAYNPVARYRNLLDYQSPAILKQLLRLGCRYLDFNIFSETFEMGSKPMVTNGLKKGQWKFMLNSVEFKECLTIISENAFKPLNNVNGSPNYKDPLIIGLNLNTGYNLGTLDLLAELVISKLGDRLLSPQFSYQYDDKFYDIPYNKIKGKVVLLASSGFEGSKLEEIINASWDDESNINNYESFANYYSSIKYESFKNKDDDEFYSKLINTSKKRKIVLRINADLLLKPGFDPSFIRRHNNNGLTIIVPNNESDIYPRNYDYVTSLELGCQFNCMNFQYLDSHLDSYLNKYKRYGILESV